MVFGATGDRDTTKRPKMGRVADDMADIIILTDDDTYTEDSMQIINMVQEGISRNEGDNFYVIPDRSSAIARAMEIAQPGGLVLLAGKGSENQMITNDGPIDWSDRVEVEKYV